MHWGGGGGVLLLLRALLWGASCRSVAKVAMAEGGGWVVPLKGVTSERQRGRMYNFGDCSKYYVWMIHSRVHIPDKC